MSFTIKQGRFEGPYHKLLELIEARKLSINEISLAQIADEYIAYIRTMTQAQDNKDDVSQFIVVASTLMIIKAKSLLPSIEYSKEEKEEISNLEYKLLLYKVLMDGTKQIRATWHKSKWSRAKSKINSIVFSPGNIKSITLQSVSILTIVKLPHIDRLRNVAVVQAVKIEHIIESLIEHIKSSGDKVLGFKAMATHIYDKYKAIKSKLDSANSKKAYTIASFLAILDMIRNGMVEAENVNEDISINIKG